MRIESFKSYVHTTEIEWSFRTMALQSLTPSTTTSKTQPGWLPHRVADPIIRNIRVVVSQACISMLLPPNSRVTSVLDQ